MTRLTLLIVVLLPLAAAAQPAVPAGMVRVDGGTYTPLYEGAGGDETIELPAFYLGAYPVTNADYLAFVRGNPEWRRSRVARIFAGEGYLHHWAGDLELGPHALPDQPVVNVSWFAARAYASWRGRRLPTTAEWEYAASASAHRPDGANDPGFYGRVLALYSRARRDVLPPVGSTFENYWGAHDLHGLVWEWTYDFNTALVTGESRNNTDLDLTRFCGSASLGATDFSDYAAFIRFAYRSGLEGRYTVSRLGFRLAGDV